MKMGPDFRRYRRCFFAAWLALGATTTWADPDDSPVQPTGTPDNAAQGGPVSEPNPGAPAETANPGFEMGFPSKSAFYLALARQSDVLSRYFEAMGPTARPTAWNKAFAAVMTHLQKSTNLYEALRDRWWGHAQYRYSGAYMVTGVAARIVAPIVLYLMTGELKYAFTAAAAPIGPMIFSGIPITAYLRANAELAKRLRKEIDGYQFYEREPTLQRVTSFTIEELEMFEMEVLGYEERERIITLVFTSLANEGVVFEVPVLRSKRAQKKESDLVIKTFEEIIGSTEEGKAFLTRERTQAVPGAVSIYVPAFEDLYAFRMAEYVRDHPELQLALENRIRAQLQGSPPQSDATRVVTRLNSTRTLQARVRELKDQIYKTVRAFLRRSDMVKGLGAETMAKIKMSYVDAVTLEREAETLAYERLYYAWLVAKKGKRGSDMHEMFQDLVAETTEEEYVRLERATRAILDPKNFAAGDSVDLLEMKQRIDKALNDYAQRKVSLARTLTEILSSHCQLFLNWVRSNASTFKRQFTIGH